MSEPKSASDATDRDELEALVERQGDAIDRLERKVDVLAAQFDVDIEGVCTRCEDGVLVRTNESLDCSSCGYVTSL